MNNSEFVIKILFDSPIAGDLCKNHRMRTLAVLINNSSIDFKYKIVLDILNHVQATIPELAYIRFVSDLVVATIYAFPENANIFIHELVARLETRRNGAGFSPTVQTWGAILGLMRDLPVVNGHCAATAVGTIIFRNRFEEVSSGVAGWVSEIVAEFFRVNLNWREVFKNAKELQTTAPISGQRQILEELSYKAFGQLDSLQRLGLITDFALRPLEPELSAAKEGGPHKGDCRPKH